MNIRTGLSALALVLCLSGSSFAGLINSINISFDESGDITVTRTIAPGGSLPPGTITVGPISESITSGFDHMGSTLTYTLPPYGYIFQTADNTDRSAWILTEPGNTNLVASAILFVGSEIVVYNRLTDSNPLDLAQAYGTPVVYQTGLPTTQDASTPLGLAEDLQAQNTAASLANAFTEYTVTPESPGMDSYTINPVLGQAGMMMYDNIDFATTISFTNDDISQTAITYVPEPCGLGVLVLSATLLLRRRNWTVTRNGTGAAL